MLIVQKLEDYTRKYTDSRGSVAQLLLDRREKIEKMSMQQIADAAYTSKSTLVRIAKQLGYSGWNEFLKVFLDEVKYKNTRFNGVDHNYPFNVNDDMATIADNMANMEMESIWETQRIFDYQQAELAVNILHTSHTIYLMGISINGILLELFQKKMNRIGVHTIIVPQEEWGFITHSLRENDCCILVSYSGDNEARTPMRYVKVLRERGVKIISITSEGDNLLRRESTACLSICSRESLYSKISTFSTEASIKYILDLLFSLYFTIAFQNNLDNKIATSKVVETQRQNQNLD